MSFGKERITCPCRNEGSSFALVEGGKEVLNLACLGLPFLDFFKSWTFWHWRCVLVSREPTTPWSPNTRKKHPMHTAVISLSGTSVEPLVDTTQQSSHNSQSAASHHNGQRSLPMHTEGSDLVHGRHFNILSGFQAVHLHHHKPGNGQGGIGHRVGGAGHSNKEC